MATIAATDINLKEFTKYGVTFYGYEAIYDYPDYDDDVEKYYYLNDNNERVYLDRFCAYYHISDVTGERVYNDDDAGKWYFFADKNNVRYIANIEQYIIEQTNSYSENVLFKVTFVTESESEPSEVEGYYDYEMNWNYSGLYWYKENENDNKWYAEAEIYADLIKVNSQLKWSFNYPEEWAIYEMDYFFQEDSGSSSNGGSDNGSDKGIKLKTIDFSRADDLSNLVSAEYAFNECKSLESVNFSNSTFENLANANYMFNNCDFLRENSIVINNSVTFSSLEYAYNMFYGSIGRVYEQYDMCESEFYNISDSIINKILSLVEDENSVLSTDIGDIGLRFVSDNVRYLITSENTVTVIAKTYEGSVTLPVTVNKNNRSFNVNKIHQQAFYYCTTVTNLNILSHIEQIEYESFKECRGLLTVSLPDTITYIGYAAFKNCNSLTKATFKSLESLMEIEFDGDDSNPIYKAEQLYVNDNRITNLNNIPNTITEIKDFTFINCKSLTSVTIPSHVTKIGVRSFESCSNLVTVNMPETFTSIGNSAFAKTAITSFTIPSGVVSVSNSLFNDCRSLAAVSIPETVTSIGEKAFYNNALTELTIPSSVTYVGDEVFRNCNNISYLKIENNQITFADYTDTYDINGNNKIKDAFLCFNTPTAKYKVLSSTEVAFMELINKQTSGEYAIPTTVTSGTNGTTFTTKKVCGGAFLNCANITRITHSGITEWGWAAMDYTTGSIFSGCASLQSISPTIVCSNIRMYNNLFNGCESIVNMSDVINENSNNAINSQFTNAFKNCASLTGEITIVERVKSKRYLYIGSNYSFTNIPLESAFENCVSITSFKNNRGQQPLSSDNIKKMFKGCTNLQSVILVLGALSERYDLWIESSGLFEDCSSLTSLDMSYNYYEYNNFDLLLFGSDMFKGCTSLKTVSLNNYYFTNSISFEDCPLTMTSINNICRSLKPQPQTVYDNGESPVITFSKTTDSSNNVRYLNTSEMNQIREWCFGDNSPLWATHFIIPD